MGLAAEGRGSKDGGSSLIVDGKRRRARMLDRMGLGIALERGYLIEDGRPGDCACGRMMDAEYGRSQCWKMRIDMGFQTSRDGVTSRRNATDGGFEAVRCLYTGYDEADEGRVAAAAAAAGRGGSQEGSHVDAREHAHVRRLSLECDLLRNPQARSRGRCLDREYPPVLRICMETTRASSLWQTTAVRPKPEEIPSLRWCADVRSCIARVWGCSCLVI
jgi:hypothetical protein